MIIKNLPLRLMVLASLPYLGSYCSLAFAQVPALAMPADVTPDTAATPTPITAEPRLMPTLVGVYINGQERDSLDVLYDASNANDSCDINAHYFLSIDNLSRLTNISLSPSSSNSLQRPKSLESPNGLRKTEQGGYRVTTPIGDTKLVASQVMLHNGQAYLALSTLKQMGITAKYNQQDLAIKLNMGWSPSPQGDATADDSPTASVPIDYHPSKAGLLGVSLDSTFSASESISSPNNTSSQNSSAHNDTTTSRQMYTDIGAYGYGLGGVWGIKATGYDSNTDDSVGGIQKRPSDDGFGQTILDGVAYLPADWDSWEVDNLYWAKSGEHLATRLGVNQSNTLGQGVQNSGSEFTGALFAYSNQAIARHLSSFDADSRSLLQNTSQDYQHLTGVGEAGGVAELRINGQAIARVQIGLDGRYEFLNLDVSQLALTDTTVEIAIYAYPLARQPLEVRPIMLGKRRTNAATDELIIEAGVGRTGNLLNNDTKYDNVYGNKNQDSQIAAQVYAEYGINNRVAVRGGVSKNTQDLQQRSDDLSWHAGANFSPSVYSNADISYAQTPTQKRWQAQLQYQREKLWASYQYQGRRYDSIGAADSADASQAESLTSSSELSDQRHQLLFNYQPSDQTTVSLNQYYTERDYTEQASVPNDVDNHVDNYVDNYYAYTSINHRFNEALNASVNWSSRDDRYGYRVLWRDVARTGIGNTVNTIALSGDNLSDTVSIRHQLNDNTSLGQSASLRHGQKKWLYQGDVSYRFDANTVFGGLFGNSNVGAQSIDNLVNIGYSLYNNQVGWLADWQLTHGNGVSFSLGYKHRYVDAIPTNRYDDSVIGDSIINERLLPAWTQNNYLYAKLSFDLFKPPKQPLKVGRYPRQRAGSVIVDIDHPKDLPIDQKNMRFKLDDEPVQASLLGTQPTRSQYLIRDIKAGDYTLTMDAENLPLEYSANELATPRVRVSNYTPTSVPMQLQKSYGISGKLADAKEGVRLDLYQGDTLVKSITTGSYGYFQAFGLASGTYTLKAAGYETMVIQVTDDFVMQLLLQSL